MELVNLDKYESMMFRLGLCDDAEELFYVFTPGNNVALFYNPVGVAQNVLRGAVLSNRSFPGHIFYVGNDGVSGANITWIPPYSRSLEESIGYLADLAERRLVGQNRGSSILLLVESLRHVRVDPVVWWGFTYIGQRSRSSDMAVIFCDDRADLPLPFDATVFVYDYRSGYFSHREDKTYDFKPLGLE